MTEVQITGLLYNTEQTCWVQEAQPPFIHASWRCKLIGHSKSNKIRYQALRSKTKIKIKVKIKGQRPKTKAEVEAFLQTSSRQTNNKGRGLILEAGRGLIINTHDHDRATCNAQNNQPKTKG
jgi:hypothetical protein